MRGGRPKAAQIETKAWLTSNVSGLQYLVSDETGLDGLAQLPLPTEHRLPQLFQ
jgi:hypothetical protein